MVFWSILVFSIPKLFIFPRIKDFVGSCLAVCMLIASVVAIAMGIYTNLYAGGDGGMAAPVASTEAFPFATIHKNILTSSSSNNITISGTDGQGAITGSGTATFGNLSVGTFEGLPALQKTTILRRR